jgi:mRNA interferase MazF
MQQPNRGEVWLVDLGMAAKVRPCLVVSIPYQDEDRVLVSIVPYTTSTRNSRFEVKTEANFLRAGAFDVQNLPTIPRAKFIRKLAQLSSNDLEKIESVIRLWLGLK